MTDLNRNLIKIEYIKYPKITVPPETYKNCTQKFDIKNIKTIAIKFLKQYGPSHIARRIFNCYFILNISFTFSRMHKFCWILHNL